ncbi:MAG TPA: SRPBCC family protein [Candidatus Limnocylindrales bacterium]
MGKIALELDISASPERAFEAFTAELRNWWPAEYTWSGRAALADIGIEPGAGGFCFEIGPHGFRCDWGRVLTWDPPRRLVFTWQIGPSREPVPDPRHASEVEVRFKDGRIVFEHRGFEKHGPSGDGYRKGLESPEGWPFILDSYRAYLDNQ